MSVDLAEVLITVDTVITEWMWVYVNKTMAERNSIF